MIKIDSINNEYSISFTEITRFNIKNAESIKNEILPLLSISSNHVIMDFEGVNFVDSSGFQILIALLKTAEINKSIFEIINVSEELKELFDLLNLADIFEIATN